MWGKRINHHFIKGCLLHLAKDNKTQCLKWELWFQAAENRHQSGKDCYIKLRGKTKKQKSYFDFITGYRPYITLHKVTSTPHCHRD